jgi:hypothetical protein
LSHREDKSTPTTPTYWGKVQDVNLPKLNHARSLSQTSMMNLSSSMFLMTPESVTDAGLRKRSLKIYR